MNKFYINGKEVSERFFKIKNYLYNPLLHYCVVGGKCTYQWGSIPGISINKKEKK